TNNIIKGATTTDAATGGYNLATYAAGNSVTALAPGSYQSLSATGGNATSDNVLVTSSVNLTSSGSVNAVLIRGNNITVSGAAGTTLTVGSATQSGTVAGSGTGNTISVPTVALGTAEGVFLADVGATLTTSGTITGTAGLTVGGAGTTALL